MNIVSIIANHAVQQPEKTAFIFLKNGETEYQRLSYLLLDQYARSIAVFLQKQGLKGQRALLLYDTEYEFICAFFGCLYAEVIPVPLGWSRRKQSIAKIKNIIQDAAVKILLTSEPLLSTIHPLLAQDLQLNSLLCLATDTIDNKLSTNASNLWLTPKIDDNQIAFIQYTSGSTSDPKGVIVSHGNLIHNQQMIKTSFGHSEKTIFSSWLPLYHDMGLIGNVLQPIYLGILGVFMSPLAFIQKPLRWLQAISQYKATTSGAPNFAYDLCVQKFDPSQCIGLDLSSWEVAFNGSEPVRAETMRKFSKIYGEFGFKPESFLPCYGMAETTLLVTAGDAKEKPVSCWFDEQTLKNNRRSLVNTSKQSAIEIVSCGRTWLNQKIVIVDPKTLIECESDQIGEIWVAGLSVTQGYWNNAVKSKQSFQARLANHDETFLRTGDLGFLLNGEVYITGRIKDTIIINGENHYPQDIELTVSSCHPALSSGIGTAFSVSVNDKERLIIVYEVNRSYIKEVDYDHLLMLVREIVARQHGLSVYNCIFVKPSSILRTSSGKIKRQACRQLYLENGFISLGVDQSAQVLL